MKTLHLDLSVATERVTYEGGLELELIGRTVNGASHKIILNLAPLAVGYLAIRLHRGGKEMQKLLDSVLAQLKGEEP